jgi:hypothetical protein
MTFFWKLLHSSDNVEKYGTARYGKHDNIKQNMRFPCCVGRVREKKQKMYHVLDKALENTQNS